MRLWGKVACGMMYVIAAILLIVSVVVPEARRESIAVAAISIAIALFGIPALVKVFSSFTGDEDILTNGVLGSATITSLEPTGWRYNRQYPIVKFNLNVDAGVRVRGLSYDDSRSLVLCSGRETLGNSYRDSYGATLRFVNGDGWFTANLVLVGVVAAIFLVL